MNLHSRWETWKKKRQLTNPNKPRLSVTFRNAPLQYGQQTGCSSLSRDGGRHVQGLTAPRDHASPPCSPTFGMLAKHFALCSLPPSLKMNSTKEPKKPKEPKKSAPQNQRNQRNQHQRTKGTTEIMPRTVTLATCPFSHASCGAAESEAATSHPGGNGYFGRPKGARTRCFRQGVVVVSPVFFLKLLNVWP